MFFYGYVDNGEKFVKVKITADSAVTAYEKLEGFADKLQSSRSSFSQIESVILRDADGNEICQSLDGNVNVNKRLLEYDNKNKSLDERMRIARVKVCSSELHSSSSLGARNDQEL